VVGGKIVLGGLYEKLGISVHRRSRGPMGDIFNSVEPFTFRQRAALEAALRRIYDQFLDRIRRGRGSRIAPDDLANLAQGRIFTGRQAVDNRLIDKLGGLDQALADLAQRVGLEPGKFDVIEMPAPMSLPEYLDSIFGAAAPGAAVGAAAVAPDQAALNAAAALLGPQAWNQARMVMTGLLLMRHEPVLTLWPVVLRMW
jgi:protease-4